jgi:hypothetical protein
MATRTIRTRLATIEARQASPARGYPVIPPDLPERIRAARAAGTFPARVTPPVQRVPIHKGKSG